MHLSYESMPEVSAMCWKRKIALQIELNRSLALGRRYTALLFLSCTVGIVCGGFLAGRGLAGGLLGYSMLAIMLVVWTIGYLYILNAVIYPEIKRTHDRV